MIKPIVSLAFFLLITLYSDAVFSRTAEPKIILPGGGFDSVEVIVSVPKDNVMAYDKVRSVLSSMPGVKLQAYCANHSVFMVYINNGLYASKNFFLEQVQKYVPEVAQQVGVKEGKFQDLVNFCDVVNSEDAAIIKNNLKK